MYAPKAQVMYLPFDKSDAAPVGRSDVTCPAKATHARMHITWRSHTSRAKRTSRFAKRNTSCKEKTFVLVDKGLFFDVVKLQKVHQSREKKVKVRQERGYIVFSALIFDFDINIPMK